MQENKRYLSYNVCFNVNRRRMETVTACEYLKTPVCGPPSACSSTEDYAVNSDEPEVENNFFSNELADDLSSEESLKCDERQVNGTSKNSASQTGIKHDIITCVRIEIN